MCPGPFIQVSIHIQKTLGSLRLILQVLLAEAFFKKNNEKAINLEKKHAKIMILIPAE